ncbi:MAG: FAD-dependent oxidoreductase [Coriobacteriales bacterium]|jgi:succinate dehydrogenase/fumarate reductase flavoprotein subunit|nr:FAD-dependent oxidoreductase [Coriobacteriales bacterium]
MLGKNLSRRAFLGGAAVTATAAVMTGLTGCVAPPGGDSSSDNGGPASSSETASSASRWSFEIPPAPIPAGDIVETIDTDILVVGGGVAGMSLAYFCSKNGGKVHLIEKMEKPSTRSNQIGGVNTSAQKAEGIPEFPINEIILYAKTFQGGTINADLMKQYLYNSARMWDTIADMAREDGHDPRLLARGGEGVYVVNQPYYKEYRTMAVIYDTNEDMVARFKKDSEAAGAVFHFNCPAEQIIKEGDKAIGVIAKGPDGYIQFNAVNGIVFATGDYAGSPEMMERYGSMATRFSDFTMYTPVGANSGEGLNMMTWIGASMQPAEHHAPMIHCLGGAYTSPNPWLRINKRGRRYENEDVPNAQVCYGRMMQPGNVAWAIWDGNYAADSLKHSNGFGRQRANDDTEATFEENIAAGLLWKADTLDDLASQIGVPGDELKKTVERYNVLCERGDDVDYGKQTSDMNPVAVPPFYAAKIVAPLLCMVGGIEVDDQYRVLDTEGEVIENLFAIGNCSGNYYAVDYPTIMAGQSHGRCLTAGMILGEALAEGRLVDRISLP